MLLPRIYPITDTKISGQTHSEQVRRFVDGGADFIQLRDKHSSSIEFFNSAKEAVEEAAATKTKIIINDRVDIALAVGAAGVHLGQNDLPPEYAREILGKDAIIGFSTHSVEQAIRAIAMPIDYLAIGPVFRTTTKENPENIVGIEGVSAVKASIGNFPIVAVGGIIEGNMREILSAGADSVAMISELLSDPQLITERYRQLTIV